MFPALCLGGFCKSIRKDEIWLSDFSVETLVQLIIALQVKTIPFSKHS